MNIEKTAETMRERIERIKEGFQDGVYQNEASISRQVVEPILRDLEWDTYDNSMVGYEYPLQGKRADIALLHKEKPIVIIEVKQPGAAEGAAEDAKKQLFQYTYHAGVQFAVITTGKEWEFYLPLKPGPYQDRQVYKLDICARETEESVNRLMRYLFYPHLCSGQAIKAAEADHGDKARAKDIQDALPKAWAQVLSECDARLMELVQDKVGDICGFTPDSDVVNAFIRKQVGNEPYQPPRLPVPVVPSTKPVKPTEHQQTTSKLAGFELYGRRYEARNGVETMVAFWEAMIERDSALPNQVERLPSKSKRRRWLASNKRDLYPARPDLCEERSRQLSTGHWISTNYSRKYIETVIVKVGKVANIAQKDIKLLYK